MEVNLFEDQRYLVTWTGDELEGRGKARLVIQSVRCFGSSQPETLTLPVYPIEDHRPRMMEGRLPDGLYQYFLADADSGEALTPTQEVFFGQRKQVHIRKERDRGGFQRFTIVSPLPLRAGDCCVDYGMFGVVPLPEAEKKENSYELSFLLRTRQKLPIGLTWAELLEKCLILPKSLENTYGLE